MFQKNYILSNGLSRQLGGGSATLIVLQWNLARTNTSRRHLAATVDQAGEEEAGQGERGEPDPGGEAGPPQHQ